MTGLRAPLNRRWTVSLGIALAALGGAGHARYCWSSTYRVRNATSATLESVTVPISFDGPNNRDVWIGSLAPGESASGTLPRFAEASVGVSFVWQGKKTEDCYGYIEGSMSHADFVVQAGGKVSCSTNALGAFLSGWLNTL
jgi:hypothetical protein